MAVYSGERTINGPEAFRDGVRVDPQLDVHSYTPHGMDWGCDGDQSRQLAFALLYDHLGDAERAERLAPSFSRRIIAELDNEWELDTNYLSEAISILEQA